VALAARMYARALFEAAQEVGRLAEVHQELADFVHTMVEVPELGALVRDPQLDSRAKSEALEQVLAGAEDTVRNFVRLVVEKGRAAQLEEIEREFERLVARAEGRLDVELTTAFELSDAEATEIVHQIERASGRSVEATRTVDPELIGGLVLQAGSLRVDASVRGRLQRLRHELVTRS
jgi:F-type H+-transporting ATPase subunit delta